jgi:hypothetical protein
MFVFPVSVPVPVPAPELAQLRAAEADGSACFSTMKKHRDTPPYCRAALGPYPRGSRALGSILAPRFELTARCAAHPWAEPALSRPAVTKVFTVRPAFASHKLALRVEQRHKPRQRRDDSEGPKFTAPLESDVPTRKHPTKVIERCTRLFSTECRDGPTARGLDWKWRGDRALDTLGLWRLYRGFRHAHRFGASRSHPHELRRGSRARRRNHDGHHPRPRSRRPRASPQPKHRAHHYLGLPPPHRSDFDNPKRANVPRSPRPPFNPRTRTRTRPATPLHPLFIPPASSA